MNIQDRAKREGSFAPANGVVRDLYFEMIDALDAKDAEIERLNTDLAKLAALHAEARGEILNLTAVVEDFKQFVAYLAVKTDYDIFRKTDEYAAFFDNLAALDNLDQ